MNYKFILSIGIAALSGLALPGVSLAQTAPGSTGSNVIELNGRAGGKRFDGIGIVNGGGATSVLLKDYPEPQRSQILDLVFKPKFGASVSALMVEIPGDGNSTQGSMPSHKHTRDDLDFDRGYMWWILREARKRNGNLTLDGAAWSAPGWVGNGNFWSQDAADYYLSWLQGLRKVYGLELDALGCRNEKGESFEFAKMLRNTLDANGFEKVKIHAFDNWGGRKLDFVKKMVGDEALRSAIDIVGAHTMNSKGNEGIPASIEVQQLAARMNKPIWNTEEHVYKKGFDCQISIVQGFNDNFIRSGATRVVNWFDVAGLYPIEPYGEDPAMIVAPSPWSGHYRIREALWGYAHYGQFTQAGWQYLTGGSGDLASGGTFVTLKSPGSDYSVIIETKEAKAPQQIRFEVGGGLSPKELCVWRSNAQEQFIRLSDIKPQNGAFTITLDPNAIYSISTTRGQKKGSFGAIPAPQPFPFPYFETFEQYTSPKRWGHLPRYFADIADAFEIVERPDGAGKCLRQMVPIPTNSWGPDWQPYTIIGDENWQDYEVSADVRLNSGESAAVMGRINHVGTGYGVIPKGYFLELRADGNCRLVVIRGRPNKRELVGDAEQQALIKARNDADPGGEKELGTVRLSNVEQNQWHNLKLHFQGSTVTAFVDGKQVLSVNDTLYARGMAGLLAGQEGRKVSMPYYDNVMIKGIGAPEPKPATIAREQPPIYGAGR